MLLLRLPVVPFRLLVNWCVFQKKSGVTYSSSTWNPPESVHELKGEKVTVRPMREKDLPGIINISRLRNIVDFAESDISCAIECRNFYGIVVENSAGLSVGCLAFMKYGSRLFASGIANVIPAYQKIGIPNLMALYALNSIDAPDGYEIFAYGVTDNTAYHSQIGLRLDPQYGSFLRVVCKNPPSLIQKEQSGDCIVNELGQVALRELLDYDTSVHKYERRDLMRAICTHPSSRTFVAFQDKAICGYGILRRCFLSYKIAPMFADSAQVARALYSKIAEETPPGYNLSMVVSSRNSCAMNMIEAHNFDIVSEMWRSRQTDNPSRDDIGINYHRVYSLTEINFSLC